MRPSIFRCFLSLDKILSLGKRYKPDKALIESARGHSRNKKSEKQDARGRKQSLAVTAQRRFHFDDTGEEVL